MGTINECEASPVGLGRREEKNISAFVSKNTNTATIVVLLPDLHEAHLVVDIEEVPVASELTSVVVSDTMFKVRVKERDHKVRVNEREDYLSAEDYMWTAFYERIQLNGYRVDTEACAENNGAKVSVDYTDDILTVKVPVKKISHSVLTLDVLQQNSL